MLWDFRRFNATCGLIARHPIIEDVNSHPLDINSGVKISIVKLLMFLFQDQYLLFYLFLVCYIVRFLQELK